MTDAKRKKAVAAIRQIIKAAHELIEIEEPVSTPTATPAHGAAEQAATVAIEDGASPKGEITNAT